MSRSICFINPAPGFPTYFHAESFAHYGLPRAVQIADLTIPTLAAFAPPDFDVRVCDATIDVIDDGWRPDYVGITGKVTQFSQMVAIAREFRRRGSKVLMGGPFASLSPEAVRPHCDVLIRGEIEEIAPEIFGDLRAGRPQEEYVGTRPDLSRSPLPRWSLYNNERALMGTVQTSRGCPFECEFCDVIQYAGRKQRHKTPSQVLREVDELYRLGYRQIFLADDNFTVYRARAKELLQALAQWNERLKAGKVRFLTQVSIDCARDPELLDMCAGAGLTTVFVGLETPNEASLRETKKRQNLRVDLVDAVQSIFSHGISVIGGMIVGFDSDARDIFERQFELAMASAVPVFSLGALVAPAATPLHARMAAAGRLVENESEVAAVPWATNIRHIGMTDREFSTGMKWLANNLYAPDAFGGRILRFVERLGPRRDPERHEAVRPSLWRSVDRDSLNVVLRVRALGEAEERMCARVTAAVAKKPEAAAFVFTFLLQYAQIRHMYDQGHFWDPKLAEAANKPLISLRRAHH